MLLFTGTDPITDYDSRADCKSRGSNLREKIEEGSLEDPAPGLLGEGGPDLHYFLLGDDAIALMP